ncbi:DNA translocase FtsK [Sulfuritalea hydrogenivorans]|uniref:DNA segregation ATPase FtsK n=1 Tax=Sulfuritalea hydrogenivorans sk43H TaxID=1223802 RepID=W0SD44_9PROT|nr:DNA translocase FtsK [Sulfuritalea hydrogenivorans]MDK9715094.1 DNA translocase FtsK 4TM domain-containing protein [Sulfuritalea sp.]BAO28685.1 DNA segregation ATPase FtsK [Sulfuritalea hydrogenivorans sk43H]
MSAISAPESVSTPLPEKIALLVHEARWLLVGLVGLYLGLVLWGFERTDPGWSHAATVERIANPGGKFGAWLSDLLLYLFGLSAWWWVALPFFLLMWGYHRLSHLFGGDRRPLLIALSGFALLLLASCGLEAMRFWSLKIALPLMPGGMLGVEVSRQITQYLGYTGGTLVLLALAMIGFSLFTGASWITIAEKCGTLLEGVYVGVRSLWDGWQDRRYGRAVAEQREVVVETERRKVEENPPPPIRIEPVEAMVPVAAKAVARADKERQAPLFFDAPGGALPPLHLLAEPSHNPADLPSAETLEFTSRLIERKLADFNVEAKVLTAHPGPVVTRYEIEPAVGVKGSQIVGLAKDLARALSLVSIRVVETVPGKSCMALELPNPKRQIVRLSEIIGSQAYHGMHSPLSMAMGKDIGGQPVVVDLAKMPHLLVAGTTGSGKSVGVNAMILSLIYKSEPKDVRMIMVDPKMLELSIYEGIPHLLAPVVTDMTKAANALHWCVGEMERRYKLMSALGVRNLSGFNSKINEAKKAGESIPNPFSLTANTEIGPEPLEPMPYIVVVIDELADLMMVVGKKIEELIARLAQKARASGIHLILATQRPSVDVITGLIKANIPTRIAFQVSSKIDSRTILDQMGAEALLGQGDMLYLAPGTGLPIRVHGAFVADDEVHHVVDHLKKVGPPDYVEGLLDGPAGEDSGVGAGQGNDTAAGDAEADPMYDQAVEVVLKTRRPSISLVQRNLRIGYNRAARLIEAMEKAGLVTPMNGAGGREVIAPNRQE